MEVIGKINFNDAAVKWEERFPDLQNGRINIVFYSERDSYTLSIFYNIQAENLYFNIENSGNKILQSQVMLAPAPLNLLFHEEFSGYVLFLKDWEIWFGKEDEIKEEL